MYAPHVPDAVAHAAEQVSSASHHAADALRHEVDHVVDVLLSPVALDLDAMSIDPSDETYLD